MILHMLMGNKQSKTGTTVHFTLMLGCKIGIKHLVNNCAVNPDTGICNSQLNVYSWFNILELVL